MSGKSKFDAVIFDFDGVLVESAEIKLLAFGELYAEYGKAAYETAISYCKTNSGIPRAKKFIYLHKKILGKSISDSEIDDLSSKFSKKVVGKIVALPSPDGLIDVLQSISAQVPCFVVSATPEDELKEIIERRFLRKFFREVLGAPRTKLQNNCTILSKYQFPPHRILSIGDSMHDYKSACEAGIAFLAYSSEPSSFPFGVGVAKSFKDLNKWLYQ